MDPEVEAGHIAGGYRMFDDLLRQIGRIPKSQLVPISLQLDDERYLDRCCPAEECGATFKVMFDDWREKVPDERAWCAICGEVAPYPYCSSSPASCPSRWRRARRSRVPFAPTRCR